MLFAGFHRGAPRRDVDPAGPGQRLRDGACRRRTGVTVAASEPLGAPSFVEPLFNGSMLILAVGLAVQAAERRQRRGTQAEKAAVAGAGAPVVE